MGGWVAALTGVSLSAYRQKRIWGKKHRRRRRLPAEAPQAKICEIWARRNSFSFTKSHSVHIQIHFFSRLRRAILSSMQSYNNIVIAFSKGKLPVHTIHNSRNEKTCFCRERNSKSAVLHHAMVIVYQYVLDFSIGSIGKVYLFRRLNCMIEMISRRSIQSGRLIRHT